MASHRSRLLEKGLLLLLLLTFLLPLSLSIFVHFTADRPGVVGSFRRWILDQAPGDVAPLPLPTLAGLETTRYQEGLAGRFTQNFAGRQWIYQCTQEAYLRLFDTVLGQIVIGRHHFTYNNAPPYDFVNEYCVQRPPADALDDVIEGLRLWRDSCRSRGVGFAIVITPSKASIYPENLPAAWLRRYDPRPRAYDLFVRRLRQEHIAYVDGHLLTLDAKARAPVPVFPPGGTHWDQYASLLTANALLRELASQGQPVRPIEHSRNLVAHDLSGEDCDDANLIQPLIPWAYPVNRTLYPPVATDEASRPSLTIIGGSFVGALGLHLSASQQFSEIHWLRYYREAEEIPAPDHYLGWEVLAAPNPDLDAEREVFAAQCLVLEINEQKLINPLHLREFFDDTLTRLPGPDTPKFRYPYDKFLPCRWNEPIKFTADAMPRKPGVFSGLSAAEKTATWSEGPDTTLRLTVPDIDQDVIVSLTTGALPVPNRRPVQQVTVFANGHPVAEWAYDTGAAQGNEFTVPRALLGDGRLILRFHYSQPTAPADFGDLKDNRLLAVVFAELTLRQPHPRVAGPILRRVDGPVFAANAPGRADPVFAVNFSDPEPAGRWTKGPGATIRLPVPPGAGDATLSAEVNAFIDPTTLPVQRARIFVHGQPVGGWVFTSPAPSRREVVIPRALLTGKDLEVEFRFSKTVSPAQAGQGNDKRQLALFFQGVQLRWLVPAEDPLASPATAR